MINLRNFIILALIVAFSLGFRGCGDKDDGVYRGSYSTKNRAKTPKGVNVVSANKINTALFPLIDAGIDTLYAAARTEGYPGLSHSAFTVALFPRSPECINPGFLVAANGSVYDQTEWDKDTRPWYVTLCAAGLHPGGNVMIVADDSSHMHNIVNWEGEHVVLLNFDSARWAATSGLHNHPIFGQSLTGTEAQSVEVKGRKICGILVK